MIGALLKKEREKKRISQQEVAAFLNISQKTYSNIESDKSKITLKCFLETCKFLKLDIVKVLSNSKTYHYNNFVEKVEKNDEFYQFHTMEKLTNQFELRLNEKDEMITLLNKMLKVK